MSLLHGTSSHPIPHEPDRGAEAAALFADAPAAFRNLVAGVAGCSPYLRGLIEREADWLGAAAAEPEMRVLAQLRADVDASTPDSLGRSLRRAKGRIALYAALADCGGLWSLEEVTGALTDFADFAVQVTLDHYLRAEFQRGKLPGCDEADLESACGMAVLAMGKMGARELNYSSDIDLIVLFDETRHAPEHFDDIRERFIRVTKRMTKLLSDVTAEGYVFRTDLRLRPDPSVTPVCLSMGAAERYYESLGRTWERAAYIKARVCAGDVKAGAAFLETLRPFVWRKHLDYAAIQDAHDMRLRIREHKGLGGPIVVAGHNMKLGRGGIREIEFFTQTRQIIAGGRDPGLRQRETRKGLAALTEAGWVSEDAARTLSAAYVAHRTVEHRIQMLADAQTHDVPASDDQIARLAHFCGVADPAAFRDDLRARLALVHDLTEAFFAPDAAPENMPDLPADMGQALDRWRKLPALRTARASEIFRRLVPVIAKKISDTANPSETLSQFDGFLAGLPAGVQLFSLFEANPQLVDLLVDICGTAPGLAQYLSKNAQVFDGVIGGTFFAEIEGADDLRRALSATIAGSGDYEQCLNTARRWMKQVHFRIGVQHLKGMIASPEAGRRYSDLAEAVLAGIFPSVADEFARRHGPMPGRGTAILGMGSLGAGSLSATSDLDLIVIYDAEGADASTGKRPLPVSTYYARLTQALVTALGSPMAEGRLYEVDMRLRPSGRKGPVATPFSGFQSYQLGEAWTWEHLALTRARVVAGDPALSEAIEGFRRKVVAMPSDPSGVLGDVADMRRRLDDAADRGRVANPWETKLGAGRMLDIELLAQAAALVAGSPERSVAAQLACLQGLGWCGTGELAQLQAAYARLGRLQQIGRLVLDGSLTPDSLGAGATRLLLGETGQADMGDLQAILAEDRTFVDALITRILGRSDT